MNVQVKDKYDSYPKEVRDQMILLRSLILEVVRENGDIDYLGEELKWSQPSFITKSSGSTFRINWSSKHPDSISLFVNCQTKLISIFKQIYPKEFNYVGNREVRLPLTGKYSRAKLSKCIELCLRYNLIKKDF